MVRAMKRETQILPRRNPVAPKRLTSLRLAEMPRDDLEDDAVIRGVRYDRTDLADREAEAVEAEQCQFDGTRLTGAILRRSQLSDAVFTSCDFASVRAQDVSLLRSAVTSSRFTGSSWDSGNFRDVVFESCRMDFVFFRHSKFRTVVFRDCNVQQADFQRAELRDVRFENCDLTGAQFAHLDSQNLRFEGCTMIDVGGSMSLKGATVQGGGSVELAFSLAWEVGIRFGPDY
ncbi:uncharacterized protein YjbI with pentapeptide repeats [Kitasatospora sp. MAA4]|uniref:pentapeptide repeat-containing protein n=1 Tax=Kitasatospora sp. MAA4 TaxID=3035093 RepID=UPI0024768846|nr:pentapeptide repeat-containing protein [Kitasatospora sp. MAA4]MDH6133483.1 uncharacterized protein YjbI with pentapeptide repeats [Kitasatospora sp. MAA4]